MTRHFHIEFLTDGDATSGACLKSAGNNPDKAKQLFIRFLESAKTAWLDSDLDDVDKDDMEEAHDTAIHDIRAYDGSQTAVEASIIVPDGTEHTYRITAVSVDCGAS